MSSLIPKIEPIDENEPDLIPRIMPTKGNELDMSGHALHGPQINKAMFKTQTTDVDEAKALFGTVDFTHNVFAKLSMMTMPDDPTFKFNSPEVKSKIAGMSGIDVAGLYDVGSHEQLDYRIKQIKQDNYEAEVMNNMGTGKALAAGLLLSLASPTAVGGMVLTGKLINAFGRARMFKAAGTGFRPKVGPRPGPTVSNAEAYSYSTAKEKIGSSGVMAGMEFGLIEASSRAVGNKDYSHVDDSIMYGAVIGLGLSSVFVGAGSLRGGMSNAKYADLLTAGKVGDDVLVPGPANGALTRYNAEDVYIKTRDEYTKKEIVQPHLFGFKTEYAFNVEPTPVKKQWETEGTGLKPLIEPKTYTTQSTKPEVEAVIHDNLAAYKKPMGPRTTSKKTVAEHKAADKDIKDTAKEVAKISHGKHDASSLANDIINDSLGQKNTIKSDSTSTTTRSADGAQYTRKTANTIDSETFITQPVATRIASGNGTPKDIVKLNSAVKKRAAEQEDIYQADLHMRGEKPKNQSSNPYDVEVPGKKTTVLEKNEFETIEVHRWEEAPAEMQPLGNGKDKTVIQDFETLYIESVKREQAYGKGIKEEHLTDAEKGSEPKEINVNRSWVSTWLGSITNTRFTGSGATILLNRAANGSYNSKLIALETSKFLTPIYTISDRMGLNLSAKVNTNDIGFELEKVFGLNQAYKYQAYQDYMVWYSKQNKDVKLGKPLKIDEFDDMLSDMYSRVASQYETVLSNKIREMKKDKPKIAEIYEKQQKRLTETEEILEEGAKDANGKSMPGTTKVRIKHKRMREAVEKNEEALKLGKPNPHTLPSVLVDDAVENELRQAADKTINIHKIYDEYPDILPFHRDGMDADIGYYGYHERRAKNNGLDSEGTWSTKMYQRQMTNKNTIAELPEEARQLFHDGIRQHQTYINAVKDFTEDTTRMLQDKFKGHKNEKSIEKIAELIEELNYVRTTEKGDRLSQNIKTLDLKIKRYVESLYGKNQGVKLRKEITAILARPDAMAREIVKGAETATMLKDSSFDLNAISGAPNFFKRRRLSIKMDVPGLKQFMHTGSQKNLAAYDYKIKGEHKVQEVFGTRDREEYLAGVEKEMKLDLTERGILGDMFDTAKGDKQIPNDPHAWSESLARTANAFTFMTSGGGFVKYAASELNVIGAKHGYMNMLRAMPESIAMLKGMYKQAKQGKLDFTDPATRDIMAFSEVFELYSRRMKSAFSDISVVDSMNSMTNQKGALGKLDNMFNKGQQEYYKLTGLESVTMFTKMVAARAFMRRLGDNVVLGKVEAKDLIRWGFDDADIPKLQSELKRVGYDGKNMNDFNFDRWADKEFAAKMRRQINRASQDTILRNQEMHKPFWLSDGKVSPIFKTTKLFMSFQFMSQERLLMAGMTDNPARTMSGMGTTAALLGFSYMLAEIAAVNMGNKNEETAVLPWGPNKGKFYRQLALMNSYSGTWGTVGQTFGFRNLDGGMAAGKFGSSFQDVTRVMGGAPLAKAFGALPIVTEPVQEAFGDGGSGKAFSTALKQTLPFNNHWMLNEFNNMVFRNVGGYIDDKDVAMPGSSSFPAFMEDGNE